MIFLKFPDEETFLTKAEEAGLTYTDESGETHVSTGSHEYSLDVVGIIYTPGEYTFNEETGEHVEVVAPVAIDGYHVNMIGKVPENFQEYVIAAPNTPNRIFAGYEISPIVETLSLPELEQQVIVETILDPTPELPTEE
jgi:hypothetical protein